MLGLVFTEFNELVETAFSADMLDDILDDCAHLESGGAYTSVGKYDHHEILDLVTALSKRSGIPVPDLVRTFGEHLFGRFVELYPAFFDGVDGAFAFLSRIEDHIHVEVKKLYPVAELPTFETVDTGNNSISMTYRSKRPFADLAEGLITGCVKHYGEQIRIVRTDNPDQDPPSTVFTMQRTPNQE